MTLDPETVVRMTHIVQALAWIASCSAGVSLSLNFWITIMRSHRYRPLYYQEYAYAHIFSLYLPLCGLVLLMLALLVNFSPPAPVEWWSLGNMVGWWLLTSLGPFGAWLMWQRVRGPEVRRAKALKSLERYAANIASRMLGEDAAEVQFQVREIVPAFTPVLSADDQAIRDLFDGFDQLAYEVEKYRPSDIFSDPESAHGLVSIIEPLCERLDQHQRLYTCACIELERL